MKRAQSGYFLVLTVMLIMVLGMLGALVAYQFSGRAAIAPAELQGMQAFYVAESGMEATVRQLAGTGVAAPLTCATLTGASSVTNASMLNGTFTATAVNNALYIGSSALSSGVTATSNSLPLNSVTGFAPHGRVRVEGEAINYAAIAGSSLVGLTRGVANTTAASHASGIAVSQSMCLVEVSAGIPSIATPSYRRQLQMAVEILGSGGEAWAVGETQSQNFTLVRWNNPVAGVWNDYSFTDSANRANLNGVSMSSTTNGWAVGDEKKNNFTFLYWNGSSWSVAAKSGACSSQNLKAVATISTGEAWAVGNAYRPGCPNGGHKPYSYRYTILKWNGSSWTQLAPLSIPLDSSANEDLNAIAMLDTTGNGYANIGFAVGNGGKILQYNGLIWVANISPTTNDLFGVTVVSASEAWAVGNNGTILRWNGLGWQVVASPTAKVIYGIKMIDTSGNGSANVGWAVGQSGEISYYNGSSWTISTSGSQTLLSVDGMNGTYAWAVGSNLSAKVWNGSNWTDYFPTVGGSPGLNSVDVVQSGAAATGSVIGSWQQTFR